MTMQQLETVCGCILGDYLLTMMEENGTGNTINCKGMFACIPEVVREWVGDCKNISFYVDTGKNAFGATVPQVVVRCLD